MIILVLIFSSLFHQPPPPLHHQQSPNWLISHQIRLKKLSTIDRNFILITCLCQNLLTLEEKKGEWFSINSRTYFFTCTWTDFKKGRGAPLLLLPRSIFCLFFWDGGGNRYFFYGLTTAQPNRSEFPGCVTCAVTELRITEKTFNRT